MGGACGCMRTHACGRAASQTKPAWLPLATDHYLEFERRSVLAFIHGKVLARAGRHDVLGKLLREAGPVPPAHAHAQPHLPVRRAGGVAVPQRGRDRARVRRVLVVSRSTCTPTGVDSISSGSPHVRCTPMWALSTCGEPNGIKKNTHPKNVTALVRARAGTSASPSSRTSWKGGVARSAAARPWTRSSAPSRRRGPSARAASRSRPASPPGSGPPPSSSVPPPASAVHSNNYVRIGWCCFDRAGFATPTPTPTPPWGRGCCGGGRSTGFGRRSPQN